MRYKIILLEACHWKSVTTARVPCMFHISHISNKSYHITSHHILTLIGKVFTNQHHQTLNRQPQPTHLGLNWPRQLHRQKTFGGRRRLRLLAQAPSAGDTFHDVSIKNWMGPYQRTPKGVARAVRFSGLGVRSVGPVGDFLERLFNPVPKVEKRDQSHDASMGRVRYIYRSMTTWIAWFLWYMYR